MSTGPPPPGGSFSLFPRDRPPSRTQVTNAAAGGRRPSIDSVTAPPRGAGRQTPIERKVSVREGKRPAAAAIIGTNNSSTTVPESLSRRANASSPSPSEGGRGAVVGNSNTAIEPPTRTGTAFSEAQTLVRENSGCSTSNNNRRSIAKLPLHHHQAENADKEDGGEDSTSSPPQLRSIFPEYNPNVPLAQQNYYPTQTSPTHIPPAVISRRLYSPTSDTRPDSPPTNPHYQQQQQQQGRSRQPSVGSPGSLPAASATRRWPPPRVDEMRPTVAPEISTTEQLRNFWKVTNGWKAPASEGRVYTFKVACEKDAPVYTLASQSGQPFYRMKLDPTSASAYVSLSRFDPAKPYKPPVPPKDNNNNGGGGGTTLAPGSGGEDGGMVKDTTLTKGWQEVLCTTLEPTTRHHAPHDGLVALLFPLVAAKMAIAHEFSPNRAAFHTAERECARLVWDDDSGSHFLVHPALAMPFCVTVERNPTWSRTEYTLEHVESPVHLARLTRDGTGTGWVEVDTGIASKIDAVYLADVAVAALVLVAHADGEFNRVEVFEPPPPPPEPTKQQQTRSSSRMSRLSARIGTGESGGSDKKKNKKNKKGDGSKGRTRLEEFELDLESQTSDYLKKSASSSKKSKDGTPGCARAVISVLRVTFKCFIWCATVAFKALTALIGLVARCVTSEKL